MNQKSWDTSQARKQKSTTSSKFVKPKNPLLPSLRPESHLHSASHLDPTENLIHDL